MFVIDGEGVYVDESGERPLVGGDLVHVYPGHPHWYGVRGPGHWSECYLVFDGPVFDLALSTGIIPRNPVRSLSPVSGWESRIESFRLRRPPASVAGADREAIDLLSLLNDMRTTDAADMITERADTWLEASTQMLEDDLAHPVSLSAIADALGMSYSTWRRAFRASTGMAPAEYRLHHRLHSARDLLMRSSLSTREIAASLGFSDERHLIRHFRTTFGMTPSRYRDQAR